MRTWIFDIPESFLNVLYPFNFPPKYPVSLYFFTQISLIPITPDRASFSAEFLFSVESQFWWSISELLQKYVVEAPVRKIQHFSPLRVSDEFSFVYLANEILRPKRHLILASLKFYIRLYCMELAFELRFPTRRKLPFSIGTPHVP